MNLNSSICILCFVLCTWTIRAKTTANFTRIDLVSAGKVILRPDSVCRVELTGGIGVDNRANIQEGVLTLKGVSSGEWVVSLPMLDELSISGFGNVQSTGTFSGSQLSLRISGNGKIDLKVDYDTLQAKVSGLGKVSLHGNAKNATYSITGSGKIDAVDVKSINSAVRISGFGKCTLDVSDSLTADISGSGKVAYHSEPIYKDIHISGVGKVAKEDEETLTESDTVSVKIGSDYELAFHMNDEKLKVIKKDKKNEIAEPSFPLVELGLNGYLDENYKLSAPSGWEGLELLQEKSVSVSVNFYQENFEIGHSNMWFTPRLALTFNNYRFDENVRLKKQDSLIVYQDTATDRGFLKSKLTDTYLMAPLMFSVLTSRVEKRACIISVGVLVGLRIGSHTKIKYDTGGQDDKQKSRSDYYLNPFRYGARFAIGNRNFSLFGDYYFSDLFKTGKGPALTPINVGIMFLDLW